MAAGCPVGCAGGCGLGRLAALAQASAHSLARPALICFGLPLAALLAGAWLAEAFAPGHPWLGLSGMAASAGLIALAGCRGKPQSMRTILNREDA